MLPSFKLKKLQMGTCLSPGTSKEQPVYQKYLWTLLDTKKNSQSIKNTCEHFLQILPLSIKYVCMALGILDPGMGRLYLEF